MATNKNAMARYRALDKCFSSRTRKYYMNDLIEACRMALERQNGDSGSKGAEGVQRRQIFDDMNDMELMYGVIIDRIQDGHKKYYRYAVGSKTMAESGPSQEEMDCILEAAAIMKRFEGVPQFDWLDDLEKKLYTTSKLGSETQKAVSFQHNQYLTGIDKWYKPIFEAIVAKKVIDFTRIYKSSTTRVVKENGMDYVEPIAYTEEEANKLKMAYITFRYTSTAGSQEASSSNNRSSAEVPTFKVFAPFLNSSIYIDNGNSSYFYRYYQGYLRKGKDEKTFIIENYNSSYELPEVQVIYEE